MIASHIDSTETYRDHRLCFSHSLFLITAVVLRFHILFWFGVGL